MRLSAVGSGRAAMISLEKARDAGQEFRIVVVDGRMPDCDAFELSRRIRTDSCQAAVVMLLSSEMMASEAPGMAAYLRKPVKKSDLLRSLLTALGQTSLEAIHASDKPPRPQKSAKSLRVLLAEDNPVNQKMVVGMLRRMGHSTKIAVNGQEALSLWSEEAFDLVLMDVQMPVMDGLTTTRKIREGELSSGSRIPIIAMTAHATKEYEQQCLAAGMDAYLSKPTNGQQLEAAIATIGAKSRRRDNALSSFIAFDPEKARIRLGGDNDLLNEIIELFIEESPKQLASLKQAIREGNCEIVERIAHNMKGELGCFELDSASQWARDLEEIGRNRTLEKAGIPLVALENEISTVISEMRRFSKSGTGSQSQQKASAYVC